MKIQSYKIYNDLSSWGTLQCRIKLRPRQKTGSVRSIGIIRDSQDYIERPEIKRKEKEEERKEEEREEINPG